MDDKINEIARPNVSKYVPNVMIPTTIIPNEIK